MFKARVGHQVARARSGHARPVALPKIDPRHRLGRGGVFLGHFTEVDHHFIVAQARFGAGADDEPGLLFAVAGRRRVQAKAMIFGQREGEPLERFLGRVNEFEPVAVPDLLFLGSKLRGIGQRKRLLVDEEGLVAVVFGRNHPESHAKVLGQRFEFLLADPQVPTQFDLAPGERFEGVGERRPSSARQHVGLGIGDRLVRFVRLELGLRAFFELERIAAPRFGLRPPKREAEDLTVVHKETHHLVGVRLEASGTFPNADPLVADHQARLIIGFAVAHEGADFQERVQPRAFEHLERRGGVGQWRFLGDEVEGCEAQGEGEELFFHGEWGA